MNELEKLAARCEAATADEQHKLLYEAFDAIFGFVPRNMALKDIPEGALARQVRFSASMRSRAHIDAAMTLVPKGWAYAIEPDAVWLRYGDAEAFAHVPRGDGKCTALALTAAALRAQVAKEPRQ